MPIGQRIRQLRLQEGLSQRDLERTTGLFSCYISRVEHGRTVPSLETLERFAEGLNVPLYRLFLSVDGGPAVTRPTPSRSLEELANENTPDGIEARLLLEFGSLIPRLSAADRALLIDCARRLAVEPQEAE